jgi:hypothetical protein
MSFITPNSVAASLWDACASHSEAATALPII